MSDADIFSYRDFNLETAQTADGWVCDYWDRAKPFVCCKVQNRRRKYAVQQAKHEIDVIMACREIMRLGGDSPTWVEMQRLALLRIEEMVEKSEV